MVSSSVEAAERRRGSGSLERTERTDDFTHHYLYSLCHRRQ